MRARSTERQCATAGAPQDLCPVADDRFHIVLRDGRTIAEFPAGAAEDDILAVAESNQDESDE